MVFVQTVFGQMVFRTKRVRSKKVIQNPSRLIVGTTYSISTLKFLYLPEIYLLGMRLIALNGRNTRIVLIAVKFKFSTCKQYSRAPDSTMKKSSRFHESAR
jgi:hypothetical protein